MITEARLFHDNGTQRIGTIAVPDGPRCDDMCDACGECMFCVPACAYDADGVFSTSNQGEHTWIVYADQLAGFLGLHPGAEVVRPLSPLPGVPAEGPHWLPGADSQERTSGER